MLFEFKFSRRLIILLLELEDEVEEEKEVVDEVEEVYELELDIELFVVFEVRRLLRLSELLRLECTVVVSLSRFPLNSSLFVALQFDRSPM